MKKRSVYLDHAASTPLSPKALHAMLPYLREHYANPANLYAEGQIARSAITRATERIAKELHCRADELVFTGSATEADNLAIAGAARGDRVQGKKIIISAVEHKGIAAAAHALRDEGFTVVTIPVDRHAILDLAALERELDADPLLVSVTMADSETGTLQPIARIAELIREFKEENTYPLFHSDATQAAAYSTIDVERLGLDMLTLSAHKLGGPKGIGVLYVRRGTPLRPLIVGGGKRGTVRAGTDNVPGIVGFAAALLECRQGWRKKAARIKKLRDELERGIFRSIPKVVRNGHLSARLPNFLSLSFLDTEGEALLLELDELGIMVNTGSACNAENLVPSAVLTALGQPYEFVHGSIRFTLGPTTTLADIRYVLKHLPVAVERLRAISPLNLSPEQSSPMAEPRAFVGGQTPHFLRAKNLQTKKHAQTH